MLRYLLLNGIEKQHVQEILTLLIAKTDNAKEFEMLMRILFLPQLTDKPENKSDHHYYSYNSYPYPRFKNSCDGLATAESYYY